MQRLGTAWHLNILLFSSLSPPPHLHLSPTLFCLYLYPSLISVSPPAHFSPLLLPCLLSSLTPVAAPFVSLSLSLPPPSICLPALLRDNSGWRCCEGWSRWKGSLLFSVHFLLDCRLITLHLPMWFVIWFTRLCCPGFCSEVFFWYNCGSTTQSGCCRCARSPRRLVPRVKRCWLAERGSCTNSQHGTKTNKHIVTTQMVWVWLSVLLNMAVNDHSFPYWFIW